MKLIRTMVLMMVVGMPFFVYSMDDDRKDDPALLGHELTAKQQQKLNRSLYLAAKNGNLEQVQQLRAQGAQINVRPIQAPPGGAPLNNEHQDAKEIFSHQPLCIAAENGHLKVVEELLKNKADANGQSGPCGQRPLERAAWNNHPDIVECLAANKADVDAGDKFGGTALMAAARQGHTSMVKKLLEQFRATADQRDVHGKSALWLAVECCTGKHKRVVKILLEKKVDPDPYNPCKQTALYSAAGRSLDISKSLVDAKANVYFCDIFGVNPWNRAQRRFDLTGNSDILDFFACQGAPAGAAFPEQGDMGKLVRNKGKARNWR